MSATESAPAALGHLVAEAAASLREAGIESARLDARLLAAHALGLPPEAPLLRPESPIEACARDAFRAAIRRRAAGEPVSRITGRREFWSLDLELGPAVLDPRPDSETLVAAVLGRLGDLGHAWRILDLGTGSGCLLLALLSELPAATGVGIDRDPGAAALARRNARRHGLDARARFFVGNWAASLAGRFDAVVSNPPYITTGALRSLSREVAEHDPPLALDGGIDGLACCRAVLTEASRLLAPSGLAALEFGEGQEGPVRALATAAGLAVAGVERDLAGRPRCLLATASS